MENKKQTEGAFVRRVTAVSLAAALALLALLGAAWLGRDSLYSLLSGVQAGSSYADALKTAEKISDEEARAKARQKIAEILYDQGAYADAAALFETLGDEEGHMKSAYAMAEEAFQAGNYEEALSGFAALGGYADSVQRQQQTMYAMAEAAVAQGDLSAAMTLYLSAGDQEKALETALLLTGDEDVAKNMLSSGGQSPESLQKILNIAQRRALFPRTVLAAGANHTAVLYADGTVAAVGDNAYGQCDVTAWRDIVQIAAGAYHTVGLKKDGTVVAAGRNDQGQCDVGAFSGVTQIACGDTDTYALTGDGQVQMTGFHSYETITRAVDVREIYAGSYGAAARTENGTFLSSHKTFTHKPDSRVLSLGLGTGFLVSQYLDGTLSFSLDLGGSWENIVWFDVSANAILAVDLNGAIRAHFFRESDAIDLSLVEGAVQCAAGAEHMVFLKEDGTLAAFGSNDYGQCDVDALQNVQ